MLEQTITYILDVNGPLLHILVFQQVKHRDKMVYGFFDCHFCRLVLTLDNAPNFVHEYWILEDGQMCIKNTGLLRPHDFLELILDIFNLILRCPYALIQPFELLGEIYRIHLLIRQIPFPTGQDKCFADGYACSSVDALYFHSTPPTFLS
ncbi:hypothetical protein D3C74_395630 [compost metagenome]